MPGWNPFIGLSTHRIFTGHRLDGPPCGLWTLSNIYGLDVSMERRAPWWPIESQQCNASTKPLLANWRIAQSDMGKSDLIDATRR